ncbi:prolyl-tRNA synthetase associated domain-containing protein [Parasedimentitalea psychrophila]|uniref:Prolyl-tRNA synthetase associated domain-containing protein n=1 Tax=Parasedimentitalea psychrophila TaxID=2997337 RepID=A0A9Y2L204_9RHOB|nr:prolyl-tRNA synthetase associated domain-containing protein [Parasedimentitalea psychrophila]WIY26515.1 prolyl-tRNA synthetase associated domain-containing protein [Parasedimentitalea psychrophila]
MDIIPQDLDQMPLSSDALLAQLDGWGLGYILHEHPPLHSVGEAKEVEAAMVVPGEQALRVKNLYLRDGKKRNYLVTLEQDRKIDLKELGAELGVGKLSFGSPKRLMQHLGILPGAVTPLSMITGVQNEVVFYMDGAAQQADVIYMHPLINTRTVAMTRADLLAFFDRIDCAVNWL